MKTFFLIFLMLFAVGSFSAEASIQLTVSPLSGGRLMRFGRIDSGNELSQEVRVRISSNQGKQYQVLQRFEQLLVNDQGQTIPSSAIQVRSLSGSNGSGSLDAQTPEPMGFSDQLIYTSGPGGESDSFVLVYSIQAERVSGRGQFNGSMVFTVNALGSGERTSAVLNVSLDAHGQLHVEVSGSRRRDRVSVGNTDQSVEDVLRISYEGHRGGAIRIYQEIDGMPRNDENDSIQLQKILFQTAGVSENALRARFPESLQSRRVLIYDGLAERDQFDVRFFLNPDEGDALRAGTYISNALYHIESSGQTVTKTIALEVNVENIFQLKVSMPPGGLRFPRLIPGGSDQVQSVELDVSANAGQVYTVTQHVMSPMTNETGDSLKAEAFEVRQEVMKGDDQPVNAVYIPVKVGTMPLFISDARGGSAKIRVDYRLRPYSTMRAGDYATVIQYSLSER
jgi:hypothetical protein